MKWGIVAVVAVAALLAYLYGSGYFGATVLPFQAAPQQAPERPSISQVFHNVIDPYSPAWIHDRQVDCVNASGTWFDQADKVGCYNIPPGGFDSTQCTGPVLTYFQNVCEGIQWADWTCTSFEVGCRY